LKAEFVRGFVYSDGWADDARLVIANAVDAAERGAAILTRTRCMAAVRRDGAWHASLQRADSSTFEVRARCLVNAGGPWAAKFRREAVLHGADQTLRLVKGSHIVVRKLFDHPFAYIFQHPDRRIVFALPFESDFTLIGTTDIDYCGDPDKVSIDKHEIDYLCALCSRYFARAVTPADVVWTYSGVRPLLDEPGEEALAVTRDYRLVLDDDGALLLSAFGGKITTHRQLAEEAVDLLASRLQAPSKAWTAGACLPGGDLDGAAPASMRACSFDDFLRRQQARYAWLPAPLVTRYAHAYGTRMERLLSDCASLADMGREILPGLFELEAAYWIDQEWALTAEDMLWRRSKLGLHMPADGAAVLADWIVRRAAA
jgi:glycerol-3-phosphate dehydrogenase